MQTKKVAKATLEWEKSEKWNRILELTSQGRRMDALGFGSYGDVESIQGFSMRMVQHNLEKAEHGLSMRPFGEEQPMLAPQ
jgi:hypothetical protein